MPEMTEIGRLIEKAQHRIGCDETAIAARFGVSWRTLHRWKYGQTKRIHKAIVKMIREIADGTTTRRS